MGNVYHASDPLRNRVYDWEDGCVLANGHIFTVALARKWVRQACRHYKVKPATVVPIGHNRTLSFYSTKHKRIAFIPTHRNPVVVLHEAAHHISDVLFGHEQADHCKEWFSIYMWLLLKFGVYKKGFLRGSLKPYRLRLRPLGPEKIP